MRACAQRFEKCGVRIDNRRFKEVLGAGPGIFVCSSECRPQVGPARQDHADVASDKLLDVIIR